MKKAFTLIELLIVVAIIAILAAIAVPNFLEAQVRAKASRCKADLRNIGLAVESYRIDNNKCPLDQFQWEDLYNVSVVEYSRRATYAQLTTPVAYLSSLFFDPFRDKSGNVNNDIPGDPRNVYVLRIPKGAASTKKNPNKGAWAQAYKKGYEYAMKSNGPTAKSNDKLIEPLLVGQDGVVYDSSNGTISDGIILYTNKGFATGNRE